VTQVEHPEERLAAITEELEQEEHGARSPRTTAHDAELEIASTISVDSMQLTAAQRAHVIKKFSQVVLEKLKPFLPVGSTALSSSKHGFTRRLEHLLKEFSKSVQQDAPDKGRKMGCKSIRVLRREIARECDAILSSRTAPELSEAIRPTTSIGGEADLLFPTQRTPKEKVDNWLSQDVDLKEAQLLGPGGPAETQGRDPFDDLDDGSQFSGSVERVSISVSDGDSDPLSIQSESAGLYAEFVSVEEITTYFTGHSAFQDFIDQLRTLIERYHHNKMDLITHRIQQSIGPRGGRRDLSESYMAIFVVDWDITRFLASNYDDGLEQDLSLCLCFVGELIDAQLTTIGDYFERVWPTHSWELLQAITQAVKSHAQGELIRYCPLMSHSLLYVAGLIKERQTTQ
jgi:hypothetical protein